MKKHERYAMGIRKFLDRELQRRHPVVFLIRLNHNLNRFRLLGEKPPARPVWAHLRFVKILLAYFSFSWKKELHVVAGDLSGTNDIAGSTRMVAWVDRGAKGLESEALGTGAMR